jgi:hypothetical protein
VGVSRAYTGISDNLTHLGNGSQVNVGGSGAPYTLDNAVLFDGTDDYITMGNVLNVTTGDFTVAGWVKTTSSDTHDSILSKRNNTGNGWTIQVSAGVMRAILTDGTSTTLSGTTTINDNQWHFLVFIFDRDANLTMYLDGQFEASGSLSASTGSATNTAPLLIGAQDNSGGFLNLYDGWLKDIMFWDKALMPYEVIDLYNEGAGASPAIDAGGYESSANLQGWWALKDTSTTAADGSGNGNSGTYTNFTGTYSGTIYDFENYLEFDGVDDYLTFSALDLSDSRSINIWFTTDAFGDVMFHAQNYGFPYVQLLNSTTIKISNGINKNYTVPAIAAGQWHMLSIVFLTGGTKVYLDGVESSTGALSMTLSGNFTALGANYGGSGFEYGGKVDSMIYVSAELSDAEITSLYNLGLGADPTSVIASPTLYYDFNEFTSTTTVVDESDNGNDGTMSNFTGTPFKGSIRRNALLFDGVDDAITISSWSSSSRSFTIACWFNVPEFAPTVGAGMILSDTTNFDFIQLKDATTIRMRFSSGAATDFSWTVPTMALDTWHALVITRDTSNDVKCYVDGVESTSGSYWTPSTIKFQRIGYYPNAAYVFDGTLSNLSLDSSNEATAAEALSFFENPLLSPYEIFSFDPEFWWPLNGEDADTVTYDFSGNNNNGAMANFTGDYWVYRD